jgi:hypothetical protein
MKKIALWLFVFSPFIVHPQYLTPGDVDILINNWDTIKTTMSAQEAETEKEALKWEAIDERGEDVIDILESIITAINGYPDDVFEEDTSGFEDFKKAYDKFMNSETPLSLQKAFDSMGWKEKGFQKIYTIIFGLMFITTNRLILENGGDETSADSFSKVMRVIHKSDLKIIEDNLQRIMVLMST